MTERPAPEHETSRRQLTHDYHHTYTGYWSRDGLCRIRIFAAPDAVPVVVATELEENRGTSITNAAEYIAAEIIAWHFYDWPPRRRSLGGKFRDGQPTSTIA